MANIDINKQPNELCENCGCPYWKQRTIIKRISGIMAGTGTGDKIMNIEYMACEFCGKPHKNTLVDVPVWKPGKKPTEPELTAKASPSTE